MMGGELSGFLVDNSESPLEDLITGLVAKSQAWPCSQDPSAADPSEELIAGITLKQRGVIQCPGGMMGGELSGFLDDSSESPLEDLITGLVAKSQAWPCSQDPSGADPSEELIAGI